MVTYGDLFTFVIMLCAVVTLVINLMHKNTPFTGCPVKGVHISPGKIRRYF